MLAFSLLWILRSFLPLSLLFARLLVGDKLLQILLADQKAFLTIHRAILVLDGQHAVVLIAAQGGDIFAPAHCAQAGNYVAPPAASLVTHPLLLVLFDLRIFGMGMEDAVCK